MIKQKLIEYTIEHSDFKRILKLHLYSDGILTISERLYNKDLKVASFDTIEVPKVIWSKLFNNRDLFEMLSKSIKVWDMKDFEFENYKEELKEAKELNKELGGI